MIFFSAITFHLDVWCCKKYEGLVVVAVVVVYHKIGTLWNFWFVSPTVNNWEGKRSGGNFYFISRPESFFKIHFEVRRLSWPWQQFPALQFNISEDKSQAVIEAAGRRISHYRLEMIWDSPLSSLLSPLSSPIIPIIMTSYRQRLLTAKHYNYLNIQGWPFIILSIYVSLPVYDIKYQNVKKSVLKWSSQMYIYIHHINSSVIYWNLDINICYIIPREWYVAKYTEPPPAVWFWYNDCLAALWRRLDTGCLPPGSLDNESLRIYTSKQAITGIFLILFFLAFNFYYSLLYLINTPVHFYGKTYGNLIAYCK